MVKEAAEKLGELAGPAAAAADSCRENPDSKLFEMMKKKALCILSPHHHGRIDGQGLCCQGLGKIPWPRGA
jgi:hypothetical protein